jgi:anthranilate phosphoribosyltransferase
LLEGLGVKIDLPPSMAKRCLDECNFAFLFAPLYHPAMRYAAGPRKELGVRTVFNILGPLTNPARVKRQLLGVFSPSLTSFIASVLGKLGVERAMVVSSLDGIDEISISAPTKVSELRDGTIYEYTIEPERLSVRTYSLDELKVKSKEESVEIAQRVLAGEMEGAVMDAVLVNSAAALIVEGMANDFKEGMEIARESIRMGLAMRVLENLRRISKEEKGNGNS